MVHPVHDPHGDLIVFSFLCFLMGYDTTLNRLGDIGSNPQTSGIVEGDIMGIHDVI